MQDTLILGGIEFTNRLFTGTGKFPDKNIIPKILKSSSSQMITVALRRVDTQAQEENILNYISKDIVILPNTSGARNAEEAVLLARLAREAGCGDFIKIEVINDNKYLFPDNEETIKATKILSEEGFIVLPYMMPDLIAARKLKEAGAAAIMPLGSPIGSNLGMQTIDMIKILIENIDLKSKRAVITSLKKRKNLLVRPSVANISNIYVTFSVEEPELNLSQVNRFLISAESMGVEVSLVLTKCDLISDKRRSYLIDKFEKWGYQVITLNLQKSDCFKNLLAELKQKECSIFMGPSGVGKTTLLNMIIPGLQNSTSPVSNKIKRGKNTTRNVELFSMSNQSYIVDTPGFNMQPLEVDIKLLPNLYSEIYKQVIEEGIKCKFRNCLHLNDEGCNLNKSFERYSFYKEMIESSKSHYYQNQED